MFKIIAITDRRLCPDLESRMRELAQAGIPFILREKDLSPEEYKSLALKAKEITDSFMAHSFIETAREIGHRKIHLTYRDFMENDLSGFDIVGVSTHSVTEAIAAEKQGATYITSSHIFPTDCKKGVPPRGIEFLKEVCGAVSIPVFALGGITPENIALTKDAGAAGAAIMSLLMTCESVPQTKELLLKDI